MVQERQYLRFVLAAGFLLSAVYGAPIMLAPAFAQSNSQEVGETIQAKTDSNIYQYGQAIQLTVEDINSGSQKNAGILKDEYAGLIGPCGVDYFDFVMLSGNYSEISSYDELVKVKDGALNVLYPAPYDIYTCPMGYSEKIDNVLIHSNSHNATISFTTPNGEKITRERTLMSVFNIQNVYGKETFHKQISSDQVLDYVDSKLLPVGKYTIIAFTLSGEITKPSVIEIVDSLGTTTSGSDTSAGVSTTANSPFTNADISTTMMLTIPAAFGTIMAVSYRRTKNPPKRGTFAIMVIILGLGTLPLLQANQAFATYNVSSQGVEAHGTSSTFTKATVEGRFEGVRTPLGTNAGLSVQNNHFLSHFTVGNDYLWSQSFVQQEIPTGSTFNDHTCNTQAGSYTCSLPSQVRLRGVYNIWTHPGLFGCPSGFSSSGGECVNLNSGAWTTVTVSSSRVRIDLNTYQEIQSPGKIYLDQKYRLCTTLSSCTSYTTLYPYTSPQYGNSGNFYYDIGFFDGDPYYGVEGTFGQCGSCNGGTGRVSLGTGTYETQIYSITNTGTLPSPAYRDDGITVVPAEQNDNLCWWDSITNSGGSSPTFTATARYNTACFS